MVGFPKTFFYSGHASPALRSFPGLVWVLLMGVLVVGGTVFLSAPVCFLLGGKQRVVTMAKAVRERPWLTLVTGIGCLITVLILLFLSSLLGPAAPFVGILFSSIIWISLVAGYSGMSLSLVDTLARGSDSLGRVLLGAGLITVLQVIPLVGPFFLAVFVVVALGGAALSGFGMRTVRLPMSG